MDDQGMEKNGSIADLQGKRVLFIAYFFPPVGGGGIPAAMRIIKFIRNLSNGELHVLTTQKKDIKKSTLDHIQFPINREFLHRVKERDIFRLTLRFQKKIKLYIKSKLGSANEKASENGSLPFRSRGAKEENKSIVKHLKDFIYNLIYFPDQSAPWIFPAAITGRKVVKKHRIDVIVATGSPWSSLVVGYLISKWASTPLIVDFRDPWTNNPFHHSKGKLLDWFAKSIERRVVEHAVRISLNTDALRSEFLNRYPYLKKERFIVLPNGYDLADYDFSQTHVNLPFSKDENTLYLVHAGYLYGPRDPRSLLEAVRAANSKLVEHKKKVCFVQVGTIQLNYSIQLEFSDLIDQGSLIIIPSMPYKDCLYLQQKMDVLVNIQPGTQTQIPSKLYDYLALERPILNITEQDGALANMITRYKFGVFFNFNSIELIKDWLIFSAKYGVQDVLPYRRAHLFEAKLVACSLSNVITEI